MKDEKKVVHSTIVIRMTASPKSRMFLLLGRWKIKQSAVWKCARKYGVVWMQRSNPINEGFVGWLCVYAGISLQTKE